MPEFQNNTERALVASGLWLLIGFIGATAVAAGLLQLFDVEPKWLRALALAFLGGVLAAASWRRGLSVFNTPSEPRPSSRTLRASRAPIPSKPDAAR